jgi:hypothetical protein
MTELTADERSLLDWLAESESGVSQYGECYGESLDSLVAKGLAQIHGPESGHHKAFIAHGDDLMFRAVSLTDAGLEAYRREIISKATVEEIAYVEQRLGMSIDEWARSGRVNE